MLSRLVLCTVYSLGISVCLGQPQVSRHTASAQLDYHERYQASSHAHGSEVIDWISTAGQILPKPVLPSGSWPSNLVIGYAGGYTYEVLKPLIIGFLINVKEGALVLLTPSGLVPGLPPRFTKRVIVQKHEMPTHFPEEAVPHAVSLRFYVVQAFLKQIQHTGKAFICDSRDVFIQRDMFEAFDDDYLHFPRESGGYRIRGPFSQNANWITQCYGRDTLDALGGHYVLNSGTFLGPSRLLVAYIDAMLEEFQHRWHCMRLHGSDQAVHNFLVYTGKFIGTGISFSIEDLEVGRFAHVAWVHGAMLDFRNVSSKRAELYNRVGDPYVAIHLWSADSPVGQQIVLPFVKEFEPKLLGTVGQNGSSSGSGRSAFDPRYQSQEEADIGKLLGDADEESESYTESSGVSDASTEAETVHVETNEPRPRARRPTRHSNEHVRGVGSN
ncbi:hypothetical protein WJX77_012162 [Trebouxia sp. C0004]